MSNIDKCFQVLPKVYSMNEFPKRVDLERSWIEYDVARLSIEE